MNIGFVGSGHIGSTLATRLAEQGHQVALSNSRGPETLDKLIDAIGSNARAATTEEAMRFGGVIVLAVPFGAYGDVPVEGSKGKIVIDATNYYAERDGDIPQLLDGEVGSSELVAAHLPDARVVKTFNSIFWEHLRDFGRPRNAGDRIALPVTGDDAAAKAVVMSLVDELGFDSVDNGPLVKGRDQQPGTPVYTADLQASELRRRLAA